MVDTIIYQKDRNNIRRKVTKLLSFVMCLMFKNVKPIFQIYDRILIIITKNGKMFDMSWTERHSYLMKVSWMIEMDLSFSSVNLQSDV